ncbi:CoA-binding protein [Candidatus Amarobacter glycogenicus]|uniref:CoA-binding protein n=1 Tax=Candidatus Amarobacter glycogenicus TaxID=3140699 RepID=UPI0031361E9C|nr:CoA-binding protein [Dehalococcoidia bacterium]
MSRFPTTPDLDRLFRPRSVAIAGASTNVDSPGHDYVQAIKNMGFAGPIYPLNRSADEVAGLKAYAALTDAPGEVDLVISCLPAGAVLDLVDQCGKKGVRFLHLFTGRFSETGDDEAADLERQIAASAAAQGVRILGPNGMGLYHPGGGLSFRPDLPVATGTVAFLSQSGNNAVEVITRGNARGMKFGKVANYGNGLDVTPGEMLRYLADDTETTVIGAYVEGVPDGRGFYEGLAAAAAKKPVIIHKAGRTQAGARSAASHTAALAGTAELWSTVLKQAGAHEARNQEQLLDLMLGADMLPSSGGRNIAIVGGGGGRSVQSADAAEENGFTVVPLPDDVRRRVREKAPGLADWVGNPVDQSILAGSGLSSNGLLELMLESAAYDLAIANVGEDWFFGRPDASDRLKHACNRLAQICETSAKQVAVVLGATETNNREHRAIVDEVRDDFAARGIPVYPSVERAAFALGRLAGR